MSHSAHPANEPPIVAQPPSSTQGLDVLGIVAIASSFSGFPLIGFIVGLIGASKAKKENRPVILSRVGWIAGLFLSILIVIGMTIFIALMIYLTKADTKFLDATMKRDYTTACGLWGKDAGKAWDNCVEKIDEFADEYTSYSIISTKNNDGKQLATFETVDADGKKEYGYITSEYGMIKEFEFGYKTDKNFPKHIY